MHPQKRLGTFAALALGLSAVAITCIVSASAIVIYGMGIVDSKTGDILDTVEAVVEEVPALRAALPPFLADAVNDQRRPDYTDCVDIQVDVHRSERSRSAPATITVLNDGDEVITTLAVRIVLLDDQGRPVTATTRYLATPLSIDNDWPGPLMPGATRHAAAYFPRIRGASAVAHEVTEIRVWTPHAAESPALVDDLAEMSIDGVELAAGMP
jgi:hypothetical protein